MSLSLSILLMNIQTFVPFSGIKGLLFTNLFLLLQVIYDAIFRKKVLIAVLYSFMCFFGVFIGWQAIVQISYIANDVMPNDLIFISHDDSMMMKFSLLTQSFYLFSSVLFFLYLYVSLKKNVLSVDRVNRLVKIGVIFYVLYGLYEWILFLLTGLNGDFLSNRITGEDYAYGLFQHISLGGFELMRLKSLAGEPSMLAYTLVPFFVYYYYLNDKLWILIFVALLLSTSSTAFLGLAIFFLFDFLFVRKSVRLSLIISLFGVILYALFYSIVNDLIALNVAKLAMEDQSGGERSEFFLNHFNAWLDSNLLHFLLGHGWGYVRSTDLFSTLLYNTGFFGFLFVTLFFLYPAYKIFSKRAEHYALSSVLVATYIMAMVSVTEPYYFHVWFFLALSYFYILDVGS